MPAAAAIIPAAIGGISSIIGGAMGAGASTNAAGIQAAAARQAAQQAQALLGTINPPVGAASSAAQQQAIDAANAAVTGVTGATTAGQQGALGAGLSANDLLSPYMNLGGQATQTLADLMAPGGDLSRKFTFQDMQQLDPGYQFRMDQASKALQASAAAKGGALGGGTSMALANYQQNLASGEYGNAFNRFMTQQQQRYGQLANLVGMGAGVSQQAGQNLIGTNEFAGNLGMQGAQLAGGFGTQGAQYAGTAGMQSAQQQAANAIAIQNMITNALTGGANAQAAGVVGAGNAWQNALQGVGGAAGQVGQYYTLRNILQGLPKTTP